MTTVGLAQPVATPRATLPSPAAARDAERERSYAVIFDRLQACFVDYSCFAKAIAAVAGAYKGRVKMIELGCGTGLLATELLAAAGQVDYQGFDASPAMIEIFAQRTARLPQAGRTISLKAPADPRRKDTVGQLPSEIADFVVMSQLLQSVPPASAPGSDLTDRIGLLMGARRLVRPGGKIFLIEEGFGESVEEHALLVNAWLYAAGDRLRTQSAELQAAFRGIDPELADQLATLPSQPALIRTIRQRLWRYGEPQILPGSAWCGLFDHLKLRYRALQPGTLKNFYLFAIDKA